VTVGRLREFNDVALEPDPQQLVTRQVHCLIEREGGAWWVVDNGSVNGTFVQRGGVVEMVKGRAPLGDGDVIRVLAKLTDAGEPVYWELAFLDPLKTQPAGVTRRGACLEYDWVQARLLLVDGAKRVPIVLRPQEHKLIRYMAQRNAANGKVPVLCTHQELITAVWGERTHHGSDDLNHLVWGIRQKVPDSVEAPGFLEAERGMGYRLRTCSERASS
jgi:DNA-binding winged helix-turn-helix (wHTH) protein